MQQVADRARVSRTTVSFVLNNTPNVNISAETRARIWQAAAELDYVRDFAALSLATGRSRTIAFVLRQTSEELRVNAFVGAVLGGVGNALSQVNYQLLFSAAGHRDATNVYSELTKAQRVDGLIISGPIADDSEVENLTSHGVSVVIHGTVGGDFYSVDVDNMQSAITATEHLIRLGHTRIAHITNGPTEYTSSRSRLNGYTYAMETANLPHRDEYIRISDTFSDTGGYHAMRALLNVSERPTGVFVASDVVAFGAIKAIREQGLRIPQDISLVGFDDIPLGCYIEPGLTTIQIPIAELGFEAGKMLLQLIEGQKPKHQNLELDTQLIIRDSTAPPPA